MAKSKKKKIIEWIIIGNLIALFLLAIALLSYKKIFPLELFGIIIVIIGPPILIGILTKSDVLTWLTIFVYFNILSICFAKLGKKGRTILFLALCLIHVISKILFINYLKFDFPIEKIIH